MHTTLRQVCGEARTELVVHDASAIRAKRIGKADHPDRFYVIETTDESGSSVAFYLSPAQAIEATEKLHEAAHDDALLDL